MQPPLRCMHVHAIPTGYSLLYDYELIDGISSCIFKTETGHFSRFWIILHLRKKVNAKFCLNYISVWSIVSFQQGKFKKG